MSPRRAKNDRNGNLAQWEFLDCIETSIGARKNKKYLEAKQKTLKNHVKLRSIVQNQQEGVQI